MEYCPKIAKERHTCTRMHTHTHTDSMPEKGVLLFYKIKDNLLICYLFVGIIYTTFQF